MNRVAVFLILCVMGFHVVSAQQIPKRVVAEHFTNTYCSVCASRNPGFYTNLWGRPQVLHIAYHPSAPYAACPLSMHNVAENNARTNYYGIFGGTPRLVIQGGVLSASANYGDASIFAASLGQTTSFDMNVIVEAAGTDSVKTTIVIKKVDASSLSTLELYGALVEDTLFFAAANGEARSYDVFRKALWGTASISVTAPAAVGDSVVYTQKSALNTVWSRSRMYAIVMLQDGTKSMVQAAKSDKLHPAAGMTGPVTGSVFTVYPNPSNTSIKVGGDLQYPCGYQLYNIAGKRIKSAILDNAASYIDISGYATGQYILKVTDSRAMYSARIEKR
ncbi:MAG: T9SS type A sorting domain-containing protein [Taibaiella sp.]|nr:T9SS type A sorting domain-containing protein [Taibaiella sp.]